MSGPDFMTTEEIKALDKLVDLVIDDVIEEKHLREVDVLETEDE